MPLLPLQHHAQHSHLIAQRGAGRPIPGDTQEQAGWGSEQPDVAVGVPVHRRGVGLGDL